MLETCILVLFICIVQLIALSCPLFECQQNIYEFLFTCTIEIYIFQVDILFLSTKFGGDASAGLEEKKRQTSNLITSH